MKRIIISGLLTGGIALAGLGLSMGTAQAFNPQPDPPGKPINAFNPQPDPPGRPITINTHQARRHARRFHPKNRRKSRVDQPVCTTG